MVVGIVSKENRITMNRLIAILLIIALFSCNNDEPALNPEPQPEKHYSLVGEWEWLGSSGGWDGDSFSPERTGNNLSLSFSRKGIAIVMENMDTVLISKYYQKKEVLYLNIESNVLYFDCDSVFATNEGYFIIGPELFYRFVIRYLTDTMFFYEVDLSDGYGHSFKRVIQ